MFCQILAVIAEFEANLIRQRTREGMDIARQNGKLRGKQPSLDARPGPRDPPHARQQQQHLRRDRRPVQHQQAHRLPLPRPDAPIWPRFPADTRPTPDIAQYDQLPISAPTTPTRES